MFVSWVTGDATIVDSLPENNTRPTPESVVRHADTVTHLD